MAAISGNVCSASNGDIRPIAGFCTYIDTTSSICNDATEDCRAAACQDLSTANEWNYNPSVARPDQGCGFDSCGLDDRGGPCDTASPAITRTANVFCQRVSFTGDPTLCCLQDYQCEDPADPNNTLCFQYNTDRNSTCDPAHRSIIGQDCRQEMFNYCLGLDLDPIDDSWIGRWIDSEGRIKGLNWQPGDNPEDRGCYYALRRNLRGKCLQPGEFEVVNFDSAGYAWSTELIEGLFERYQQSGYRIEALPGQRGYNQFTNFLYRDVCQLYPGICDSPLTTACERTRTTDLTLNPLSAAWCGCHLPDREYRQYVNEFLTPIECTPMCNRSQVIPRVDGDGQAIICDNDVCIIDSTTIDLANSTVGGNINIRQICGNCGGSSCSCIVNDTEIIAEGATIGGNITVGEMCTSSLCIKPNPDGDEPATIIVPCSSDPGDSSLQPLSQAIQQKQDRNQRISLIWILFLVLALVVIIGFLIYF